MSRHCGKTLLLNLVENGLAPLHRVGVIIALDEVVECLVIFGEFEGPDEDFGIPVEGEKVVALRAEGIGRIGVDHTKNNAAHLGKKGMIDGCHLGWPFLA